MARDRAWRRYVQEKVVKQRLKVLASTSSWWRGLEDVNGFINQHPRFIDYVGTKDYFQCKSITTPKWVSKRKIKYSPNKSKEYYRDSKKLDTREYRDREFFRILREYGIK